MSSEDKALRKARSKLDKALEGNHHAEAVEALAELRRYEPQNVRWPQKQGDLLRKLGRNAEAVECFEQAVSLYTDQGFIARAVAMAKTVVQLDPARIEILARADPQAAHQRRAAPRPVKRGADRPARDRRQQVALGGGSQSPTGATAKGG